MCLLDFSVLSYTYRHVSIISVSPVAAAAVNGGRGERTKCYCKMRILNPLARSHTATTLFRWVGDDLESVTKSICIAFDPGVTYARTNPELNC